MRTVGTRLGRCRLGTFFAVLLATGALATVGAELVPPPPSSGATSGAPITRAATFPKENGSRGDSTITISPQRVGDLVVLAVKNYSSFAVTSVTGGHVGTWKMALAYANGTTEKGLHFSVWWGIATSTGSSKIRITYSITVGAKRIELLVDSFTSTASGWSLVNAGGSSNPTSASVDWPTLTSGNASAQLYWGDSEEVSSGTTTSTPWFTSTLTRSGSNCFLYDGSLARDAAYAPDCGDTPPYPSTAVGAIFAAG